MIPTFTSIFISSAENKVDYGSLSTDAIPNYYTKLIQTPLKLLKNHHFCILLFYYDKKQKQLSYLNGHLFDIITFFFCITCLNYNSNMIKDSVQKFTKKSQLKKKSCNEK